MENLKEIILIEDNLDDAELVLGIFKRYKIAEKTIHLVNGEEALDVFFNPKAQLEHALSPRLIILDIKMPKVDGFTVLKELKSHKETRNTPVIIFSSSEVENDIQQAYESGANSYVVKPIDYDDFEVAIERLIDFWLNLNRVHRL